MKKFTLLFSLTIVAALFFSSCKTAQMAKFTSIDKLCQLPMNASYETTVQTLGCEPYNLLTKQADGYSIYTYKYKLIERKFDSKLVNSRGGETAGEEVYVGKTEDVLLIFKDNKLISIITDEGREKSDKLVMFNNTLYEISKNNGQYIIVPVSYGDEAEKSSVLSIGKK